MDEYITTDPAICSGKPVIRGTRIMVKNIFGMIAGGYAMKDILHAYLELSEPMVKAALIYAAKASDEKQALCRRCCMGEP